MLNWTYNAEEEREAARDEGKEQGIIQGIEQGIEQGIIRTAVNLILENQNFNFISKITGLTIERITELDEELKHSYAM